jgi:hypothetical protein
MLIINLVSYAMGIGGSSPGAKQPGCEVNYLHLLPAMGMDSTIPPVVVLSATRIAQSLMREFLSSLLWVVARVDNSDDRWDFTNELPHVQLSFFYYYIHVTAIPYITAPKLLSQASVHSKALFCTPLNSFLLNTPLPPTHISSGQVQASS